MVHTVLPLLSPLSSLLLLLLLSVEIVREYRGDGKEISEQGTILCVNACIQWVRLTLYLCLSISMSLPLPLYLYLSTPESVEMATSLSNFGLACGPLGRTEEADEAFQKALRIHEAKNGPESMQVQRQCHTTAWSYRHKACCTPCLFFHHLSTDLRAAACMRGVYVAR